MLPQLWAALFFSWRLDPRFRKGYTSLVAIKDLVYHLPITANQKRAYLELQRALGQETLSSTIRMILRKECVKLPSAKAFLDADETA